MKSAQPQARVCPTGERPIRPCHSVYRETTRVERTISLWDFLTAPYTISNNTMGGRGWDEEKNWGEEDSVVYIGDMLDLEDAMEHGKGREGFSSEPPVVTRSGRVVKMGHLSH